MSLGDAIALMCADICLQVDAIMPRIVLQAYVVPGKMSNAPTTTWLVKGGHLFTMFKHGAHTLLFCHANQLLYFAQPQYWLGKDIPQNNAFLAQFCIDKTQENPEGAPRLLVMDLVYPLEVDPVKRGAVMRSFQAQREAFPITMTVQWSGCKLALEQFISKGLPHEVEGIVELTRNPLRPVRELTVNIPTPSLPPQQVIADLGSTLVEAKLSKKSRKRKAAESSLS